MEELISTDVLDREILEDARKKAFKILKNADEKIASQNGEWEKKSSVSVESIRKVYADRLGKTKDEIFARLPLDKRRMRSELAEKKLNRAIDDFLFSLDREKLLAILEKELLEKLQSCVNGGDWNSNETQGIESRKKLIYSSMSREEAGAILEKALLVLKPEAGCSPLWEIQADSSEKIASSFHEFPALVIQTRDLKISASVKSAADSMMREKRAELAAALLGEEVLND